MKTLEETKLVLNAAGRMVPEIVNGRRQAAYEGAGQHRPQGNKAGAPIRSASDYPENGDKRVADLETALRKCGLRDGMVISSHHHLRDGDRVNEDHECAQQQTHDDIAPAHDPPPPLVRFDWFDHVIIPAPAASDPQPVPRTARKDRGSKS